MAALALASFGCKKDGEGGEKGGDESAEKGGDKGGEAKDGDKKSGSAKASKGAAPSKTSFAVFSKDYDFVVGLNANSLRSSGLWKKFGPMIEGQLNSEKDYKSFKDTCGFDPVAKIESVIIAGNSAKQGAKPDVSMVIKGFNKGEAKACAEKMAKKEGEELKIEEDGKLMKVSGKGDTMWLAWLDDGTVFTGSGAEGDGGKAWVEARIKGQDGMDKNADMNSLLGQVDSNGTVWFAAQPADTSAMAMMGAPPKAMFGTVLLTSGLKADIGLRYEKADDATKMVEQSKQMMGALGSDPTAKMIADKTKLSVNGNDAIIKMDLSEEELGKVLGMAQQMMGAFMR